MGIYVNPRNETKEDLLRRCGHILPYGEVPHEYDGHLLVCYVVNAEFTALAVCTSDEERDRFLGPDDPRPKRWFYVSRADLEPYL